MHQRKQLKAGDIIGFSGNSWLSAGICLATLGLPWWSLSHVAILGEYQGRLLAFEATTLCNLPGHITGKTIRGTQAHSLDDRLASYDGKAWHYALTTPLFDDQRE